MQCFTVASKAAGKEAEVMGPAEKRKTTTGCLAAWRWMSLCRSSTLLVLAPMIVLMGCENRDNREVAEAAAVVAIVSTGVMLGALSAESAEDAEAEDAHDESSHKEGYETSHRRRRGDGHRRDREHHDRKRRDHDDKHEDFHEERRRDERRFCRHHPRAWGCERYRWHGDERPRCYRDRVCYLSNDYYGRSQRTCWRERVCRMGSRYKHKHGGLGEHSHQGTWQTHTHRRFFSPPSADPQKIREALAESSLREVLSARDFARAHHLSVEAATQLLDALESARTQGDLTGLHSLGFSAEDLRDLAHLRLPSDESVDRIAQKLNHMPALTMGMLARMIKQGKRLMEDFLEAEEL